MQHRTLITALVVLMAHAIIQVPTHASEEPQAKPKAQQAVNKTCPIGKEPIDGKTFANYKGKRIGFCCPGCDKKFLAWDDAKKDAFLARVERSGNSNARPPASESGDPYVLATCVVSGEPLGSMGEPIVRNVNGREIRLCCKGCIKKFDADQAGYIKKIDELIVKDQLPHYPTDKCVVTGEPLFEGGKDIGTNLVYKNQLVRLCCKMCVRDFQKDPSKYVAKLDKAVIQRQGKKYPLDTCPVSGEKLGSMGKPIDHVIGNRLVRLCCKGCDKRLMKNPVKHIATIDSAWTKLKADSKP